VFRVFRVSVVKPKLNLQAYFGPYDQLRFVRIYLLTGEPT